MSNYDLLKQKINSTLKIGVGIGTTFVVSLKDNNFQIGDKVYIDFINDRESVTTYRITDGWLESYYNIETINERFINKGKEPMLNDVLEWIRLISEYTDEYCITIGGDFLKMNFIQSSFELINSHTNPRWDLSNPYLKDQSPELLEWLSTLG